MARTLSLPETTLPVGSYTHILDRIPNNTEGYDLSLTRVNWPEGLVAQLTVESSRDDGTTWAHMRTVGIYGGVIIGKDGNPLTVMRITGTWPGENDGTGGRRKLRGTDIRFTLSVAQQITTAILLDTF